MNRYVTTKYRTGHDNEILKTIIVHTEDECKIDIRKEFQHLKPHQYKIKLGG